MLKFENVETYGWEAATRGLRNPMNSWAKSDSEFGDNYGMPTFTIGEADKNLMMRMNKSPEESKYRRMITVTLDIVAPLYWWKEYDTYKVGTVCNSCSTMHKIHSKEFTLEDFSADHLFDFCPDLASDSITVLEGVIEWLNQMRNLFLETKNKDYWWQMIQLLPTSYNQRRTIQLNYEVLAQIYRQRKNHKLDEWHTFCDMIKSLPYSQLVTGESVE